MSIQAVAWVLDHSQSRGLDRLVLISLANHANKDSGECFPSLRTISKESGAAVGTVRKAIKHLETLGELEVLDKGDNRFSATYKLNFGGVSDAIQEGVSNMTLSVSPGERSVSRSVIQNRHEPEEEEASSSYGSVAFADFHAKRAVEAVDKRRRNGLKVKSRVGLAKTIAQDPDFIDESKRIWEHRDCARCKGKGEIEEYSPGAGMTAVECNA